MRPLLYVLLGVLLCAVVLSVVVPPSSGDHIAEGERRYVGLFAAHLFTKVDGRPPDSWDEARNLNHLVFRNEAELQKYSTWWRKLLVPLAKHYVFIASSNRVTSPAGSLVLAIADTPCLVSGRSIPERGAITVSTSNVECATGLATGSNKLFTLKRAVETVQV